MTYDFTWTDHAEFEMLRAQAQTVPCPFCHAEVDQTCQNKYTGHDVRHFPAHPVRFKGVE